MSKAFVDLEKAFDSVKWKKIYNILVKAKVTLKNKKIIKSWFE